MSILHCLKCEFVVRVPIPGGPAMELRCGRIDRMVDVCLTVMGCPKGKFPASQSASASASALTLTMTANSLVVAPEEVERRRGVCSTCEHKTADWVDGAGVICDAQLQQCSTCQGNVSLTIGKCPLGYWPTLN